MRARKLVLAAALTLLIGGEVGVPAAGASQVRCTLIVMQTSTSDRAWSEVQDSPQHFGWEYWHESTWSRSDTRIPRPC